jgi:hypothetical protein
MPLNSLESGWRDCRKILPYFDYQGKLQLLPIKTQTRTVLNNGRRVVEYREIEETLDEWGERQW